MEAGITPTDFKENAMKKSIKKLKLNTETLRFLDLAETGVAGGLSVNAATTCVTNTWYDSCGQVGVCEPDGHPIPR